MLRNESSSWLTWLNLVGRAVLLFPFLLYVGWPDLTLPQLGTIALMGAVQLALPYWLVTMASRSISPQEIGMITLLEPVLTPIWAYCVAPQKEVPSAYTIMGGVLILAAVASRYWPTAGFRK